jgi:hypothetical protein
VRHSESDGLANQLTNGHANANTYGRPNVLSHRYADTWSDLSAHRGAYTVANSVTIDIADSGTYR